MKKLLFLTVCLWGIVQAQAATPSCTLSAKMTNENTEPVVLKPDQSGVLYSFANNKFELRVGTFADGKSSSFSATLYRHEPQQVKVLAILAGRNMEVVDSDAIINTEDDITLIISCEKK